jgi:hypothetical protein
MLSIFGFSKSMAQSSNSQEELKGIIGEYYEDGLPVIMKFVNELPDQNVMDKLPILTVISWKYDGSQNNGMPLKKINKRMILLEEALEDSMESSKIFTHAYSRTGNNLKELVYYTTEQEAFMTMLNQALESHDEYPIDITFYEDKDWAEFKNVLKDFSE